MFEGACIADHEAAALALEQRGIGLGQATGIGNETRLREIHGATELTVEVGLFQRDRLAIENVALDAILLGALEFIDRVFERPLLAKQLDPADPPQQFRHARFRDQRLMLDQAALDQWQFRHRTAVRPFRRRRQEVAHQPRQEGRQIGQVIMRLRRPVQRILQNLTEIAREHIGENRGSFDQPGIAKTRPLAGVVVLVQQDHVPSPLL